MKKLLLLLIAFLVFCSHDMFLKLDNYFLKPNTSAIIKLYNGTFDKSENVITRNRMIDVSLTGNGIKTQVDTSQWSEKDSMTILSFETGDAGTWVAGVSTRPRNIEMAAKDFNEYLEHDGVLDMLKWRKENDALDDDAIEKYSKHVKTIFQVGDKTSSDWQTELGYPIEFVPQSNPYEAKKGDEIKIKLIWQGKPLSNQLVYIGTAVPTHNHDHDSDANHSHDHDNDAEKSHHHHSTNQLRTDGNGILNLKLNKEGVWHLRTIHLVQSKEEGLTHESNWATLTFELGHGHIHEAHEHASTGIPSYVYWVGSLVLLIGLFLWFNRKN
jgi:uncharacterized GH25 family protein